MLKQRLESVGGVREVGRIARSHLRVLTLVNTTAHQVNLGCPQVHKSQHVVLKLEILVQLRLHLVWPSLRAHVLVKLPQKAAPRRSVAGVGVASLALAGMARCAT
jgi:hypothetical protein